MKNDIIEMTKLDVNEMTEKASLDRKELTEELKVVFKMLLPATQDKIISFALALIDSEQNQAP